MKGFSILAALAMGLMLGYAGGLHHAKWQVEQAFKSPEVEKVFADGLRQAGKMAVEVNCPGTATTTGDNSAAVTGSGNVIISNGEPCHGDSKGKICVNGAAVPIANWSRSRSISQVSNGSQSANVISGGDVVITYPKEPK